MKAQCVTIQIKAIEQYFHVVLFIMLYKVVLTVKSVDETQVCDHLNLGELLSRTFTKNWIISMNLNLATALENEIICLFS